MRLIDFIFSKLFLKHLLIAIVVGNIVFWGSLYLLNIYTRHGEAIEVPSVKGLSIADAEKKLAENNMMAVVTDSIFLLDKPKGSVIDQNPPEKFLVKSGRKVFLVVNSFFPERIQMPNLVGVSIRQAKAILETYGLKPGKTRYVPDIAKDNVLEQRFKGKKIAEGDLIEKGSSIDFVLGKGEEEEESDSTNVKEIEPDEENL